MGLSVNQIDTELTELLGIDDDDYSSVTRLLWINRSFWEITAKFEFKEKEGSYTFNTVDGTSEYNVPVDIEALQGLSIVQSDGYTNSDLNRMEQSHYQNVITSNPEARAIPERYYREGNKIILYPTPNDARTVTVKYLKTLPDLLANGSVVLPQEWHELILFGAAYRGFLVMNDKVSADFYRNQQANLTATTIPTEAKEEKDSKYAAVDVVTRRSGSQSDAPRRSLWRGHR
jgi:hypothetical protein